jgi:hypothetical protein
LRLRQTVFSKTPPGISIICSTSLFDRNPGRQASLQFIPIRHRPHI